MLLWTSQERGKTKKVYNTGRERNCFGFVVSLFCLRAVVSLLFFLFVCCFSPCSTDLTLVNSSDWKYKNKISLGGRWIWFWVTIVKTQGNFLIHFWYIKLLLKWETGFLCENSRIWKIVNQKKNIYSELKTAVNKFLACYLLYSVYSPS